MQTSHPQTSDVTKVGRDKRRTGQTSDQYKREDGYIYKEKRRTLVEVEKKANAIRNKIFKSHTYCEKNQRQLNKVSSFEGSTV